MLLLQSTIQGFKKEPRNHSLAYHLDSSGSVSKLLSIIPAVHSSMPSGKQRYAVKARIALHKHGDVAEPSIIILRNASSGQSESIINDCSMEISRIIDSFGVASVCIQQEKEQPPGGRLRKICLQPVDPLEKIKSSPHTTHTQHTQHTQHTMGTRKSTFCATIILLTLSLQKMRVFGLIAVYPTWDASVAPMAQASRAFLALRSTVSNHKSSVSIRGPLWELQLQHLSQDPRHCDCLGALRQPPAIGFLFFGKMPHLFNCFQIFSYTCLQKPPSSSSSHYSKRV